MKKAATALFSVVIAAGLIWAGLFYWKNLRGIGPALGPPPADIVDLIERTGQSEASDSEPLPRPKNEVPFPLTLPVGFSISVFAKDLPGVRVMKLDALGNMWVSQTSEGIITLLEIQDGVVTNQYSSFRNLRKPHGLAFDPDNPQVLYIAEEDKISRVATYADGSLEKIIDLPKDGGHFTRTIGFGPDGRLYVSVGSSCNVCHESDARRARIFTIDDDGGGLRPFARGLRNSVFFAWHPETEKLWATDMGRDLLGDDVPPDEINIIEEGKNYGWPVCYGKNIHDTDFDKSIYKRNPCMEPFETGSAIDVPAHSAPLGLAFIPATPAWPEEYWHDLIVAYHGSWNRSTPTGYKLVRFRLDQRGNIEDAEDFVSGWLTPAGALGRPVDILVTPEGAMYVSDDKAGVIYEIRPRLNT